MFELYFLVCTFRFVFPELYFPNNIFRFVFSRFVFSAVYLSDPLSIFRLVFFRFVSSDLYVLNGCFRLVLPDLYYPVFFLICIIRLGFPRLTFADLYFPTCICFSIYIRRFVLVRSVLTVCNFPICVFPIVFSDLYFPSCMYRVVLSDLYLPNCICSMFIFQLFNTWLIVFSASTHSKTRLTKCCILDGVTKKRGI